MLNTSDMFYSYGGISPFMKYMHPYLEKAFSVDYIVTPNWLLKFPGPNRFYYLIYVFLHAWRMKKYDFILSHAVEGSYVASFVGVPYAHIFHGNSNPVEFSRFFYGKWFVKVFDKMYSRIEKTASIQYTVGSIRNQHQKKLYNPLEQNVPRVSTQSRSGFVFSGRLESVKRVDKLITLYSKLPNSIREENNFFIVGYGSLENDLKQIVDNLGLNEKVIFTGKVDNSLMMKTISDKRIMLMASMTEGFPTAIAEALSVGLPVISTDVGDIASVIINGKNGELLPLDFDDDDYIYKIQAILNDYDNYAENAYLSSTIFNSSRITADLINDINTIIQSKNILS